LVHMVSPHSATCSGGKTDQLDIQSGHTKWDSNHQLQQGQFQGVLTDSRLQLLGELITSFWQSRHQSDI
jgi:hypothetical protein